MSHKFKGTPARIFRINISFQEIVTQIVQLLNSPNFKVPVRVFTRCTLKDLQVPHHFSAAVVQSDIPVGSPCTLIATHLKSHSVLCTLEHRHRIMVVNVRCRITRRCPITRLHAVSEFGCKIAPFTYGHTQTHRRTSMLQLDALGIIVCLVMGNHSACLSKQNAWHT